MGQGGGTLLKIYRLHRTPYNIRNLRNINPKNPFVCPKEGITPTFEVFSDGIATPNLILGRGLDS